MNPNEEGRRSAQSQADNNSGPFLGKVVSHLDPYYMGTIEVELLHKSGNQNAREGQVVPCKYMSPFAGITSVAFIDENNEYNSTQKSYGMWFVPPDIGTTVIVFLIDGDITKAYWVGCVQDPNMNFMVPGYAATSYNVDGDEERVPVAEYNKKANDISAKDTTQLQKPTHKYFQTAYTTQGLLKDDVRGITSSSARREVPSAVFGISTPGPVDKLGPRGKVGKYEHAIPEAFISRLGGSSFVMDDGDDKWEREKTPSEGPPVYKSVEGGDTGLRDRPHNELIRLRTRTGHQILLHNSEDLIYIGNSRGTAWIELSSDGKIDIYAEDSFSLHTKQDINFYADRDINFEAGRNFNIKVAEEMHTNVIKDHILIVDGKQKIHIKQDVDKTYDQKYTHTVKQDVNKVYKENFTHTVLKSVSENFASSGGTVKVTTGGSIDVVHNGSTKMTYNGAYDHKVTGDRKTTTGGTHHLNSGGQHIETASQIHMNGPAAAQAASAASAPTAPDAVLPLVLKTHSVPNEEGAELVQAIMRRVPTHEPWPHHENLDPEKYKPEKTDRDIDGRNEGNSESIVEVPEYWTKYTTETDTFAKIKGGE